MNKVEELHDNANQGQILAKLVSGQSRTREANAHAKVTEDVACKFQDWANNEEFWYEPYNNENDIKGWASTKLNLYGLTTSELYQEFIKTL